MQSSKPTQDMPLIYLFCREQLYLKIFKVVVDIKLYVYDKYVD